LFFYNQVRGDLRRIAPRKKLLNSPETASRPRASLARGFFILRDSLRLYKHNGNATETSLRTLRLGVFA
ncbi:MAG TPA: hypothetical protein VNO70_19925, partial [Blastocatellia bacterium]|nr:hypothetical protein [Blastocatellia bacterium]